ncbi:MAG: 16S rRNA (adenine(1518)-N(6)/adenine(1519)-N(6))-dimethyltransferase RsmA [Planctomycetota bacterium]
MTDACGPQEPRWRRDQPWPTRRETLVALAQRGFRFQRKLGQCFLFDRQLLEALVRDAGVRATDRILEIGAGAGTLTMALLSADANVVSVEIDARLADYLRAAIDAPAWRLIEGDALETKNRLAPALLDALAHWTDYALVANLPYAIANPLVLQLVLGVPVLRRMGVLVQVEIADRWCAEPGTAQYGTGSIVLALAGRVKRGRTIARELFTPPPNVDSVFVTWQRHEVVSPDLAVASQLARTLFLHRRKMLRSILREHVGPDDSCWLESGVDPRVRPEDLEPEQFAALGRVLRARGVNFAETDS